MPISPTVPSAVNPVRPSSLQTTLNDRAFYINSGLVSVDNTETTVISVNDVGRRDILFCINPIVGQDANDNMFMKVKNNGSIIYQTTYYHQASNFVMYAQHFIIPANTSIEITFQNQDASFHDVGISAYGYYLV